MIKFEHQWGGEDTWYTKSKRWANKQKFPINHLVLGFIEWLYKHWVDGKVEQEMQSVDKQAAEILKDWEEDAAKYYEQPKPEIVERGVFGEEGWSISMSNPVVDRGTQEPESSMGTSSNEVRLPEKLPDPWYMNDPNDAEIGLYYEFRNSSRNVED